MKQVTLTIFLLLSFLVTAKAQDSEISGEFIPYTKWLAKIEEENKKTVCIIGEFPKPDKIKLDYKIETKTLQSGEKVAIIEISTNSGKLVYRDLGRIAAAKMRYFGRIISKDYKINSVFEEILTIDEIPIKLMLSNQFNFKIFPVIYRRTFRLPKGKYSVNFVVDNTAEGISTKKIKFEIK